MAGKKKKKPGLNRNNNTRGYEVLATISESTLDEDASGVDVEEASSSLQRHPDFIVDDAADDPNFRRPPSIETSESPSYEASIADGNGEPNSESVEFAAEKEAYVLSATGDVLVKLLFNNVEIRYLVIGHILRVVSPIWEKCLDPNSPFKSEKALYDNGEEMLALHLEDDDPDCLLNLFRCTHFQYADVPKSFKFHQLKSLAMICDKYDCAKVLKPWSDSWLAPWEGFALTPGYEHWLFVTKVFGYTGEVEKLISLLANSSSSLSACGSYLQRDGRNLDVDMIPELILGRIIAERERIVKALTENVRQHVDLFLDSKSENLDWCSNEACVGLAYGSLVRSIKKSGLWVLFSTHRVWHGSVKDLREKLNSLNYVTMTDQVISSNFIGTHYDSYYGRSNTVTPSCNHSCKLITNKTTILSDLKGQMI
ncbi:hypothetical protein TWF694_009250 [Orbilia ellipsospora]|uniref:BTB domain-containing protein n=1 Tax=Orbilia ellipsospora TaxID=2528407 RepID=A0AAV9XFV3_9PEZI